MGLNYWACVVLAACLVFNSVLSVDAVCSSPTDGTIWPKFSTVSSGEATYYGTYVNGGHCSLDPTPTSFIPGTNGIFATAAIATPVYANSAACGMCVEITATGTGSGGSPLNGKYVVYVNNECPTCGANGIDLGLNGDGLWGITWKAVPCPVGTSKIQYTFQGSHNYYIKLQARNTKYPVKSISINQGGTWKALKREVDNFFSAVGTSVTFPVTLPMQVQLVAANGDTVTDSIASISANGVILQGAAQFSDCGTSGSATTASATTASVTTASVTTAKLTTTTTTKTSTTTTGSSSTTGTVPAAPTLAVYTDALQNGFADWSWGIRLLGDTTRAYAGTKSIKLLIADAGALYFRRSTIFTLGGYASFQFYVFAPTGLAANVLKVLLYDVSGNTVGAGAKYTSALASNVWVKVSIPVASFGVPLTTQLLGVGIQGDIITNLGNVWVDEIYFIGK